MSEAKRTSGSQEKPSSPPRGRRREPLHVTLSVTVRTGPNPEDRFELMRDRELRMVGNVFAYRDRILRYFIGALYRVALASPAVYRQLAPGLATLLPQNRERK